MTASETAAPTLQRILAGTRGPARHWRHVLVDRAGWQNLVGWIGASSWRLLGLWGERDRVHVALYDEPQGDLAVATLDCPEGSFPSLAAVRPGAQRLERAVRDLFGLRAEGAADTRPWLDHGRWPAPPPGLQLRPAGPPYPFLPAEGQGVAQIPVGPVHAGIIEPGHFRFHAQGETVVRLEPRLGYTHKGTEALMAGAGVEQAARLAGRVSGDSTVAYAWAFALAYEEAMQVPVPPRALWLRALMAELERLANHLGDIGAIANDASFAVLHARFAMLRERVLRTAFDLFGHRLMMDRIVPGGVSVDLGEAGSAQIAQLLTLVARRFRPLVRLYDRATSLQDRTVGTGRVDPALAEAYGAGGYVGRAAGRVADARRSPGYAPYDQLDFDVPLRTDGDVNARVWVRIDEVEQCLRLIPQILERLPDGPVRAALPDRPPAGVREGLSLVESFRGEVLVYLRLAGDGTVARCHLRDPSWFLWPLLEKAVEGNIVADFPLCNKSFNCSYSGHDL